MSTRSHHCYGQTQAVPQRTCVHCITNTNRGGYQHPCGFEVSAANQLKNRHSFFAEPCCIIENNCVLQRSITVVKMFVLSQTKNKTPVDKRIWFEMSLSPTNFFPQTLANCTLPMQRKKTIAFAFIPSGIAMALAFGVRRIFVEADYQNIPRWCASLNSASSVASFLHGARCLETELSVSCLQSRVVAMLLLEFTSISRTRESDSVTVKHIILNHSRHNLHSRICVPSFFVKPVWCPWCETETVHCPNVIHSQSEVIFYFSFATFKLKCYFWTL